MNYIYGLLDPRDDQIRYVGKTDNLERRYQMHLRDKYHCYRVYWIQSLREAGLLPTMKVIEEVSPEQDWGDRERYWVQYYREAGCRLTNGTDGGDCGPPRRKGQCPKSTENYGKFWTGRRHSESTREKMRRAKLGKKMPDGYADKMRAYMTGRKLHTDAFKVALAERNRQREFTPERRERLRQVQLTLPPETKRRISEAVASSNRRRARKGTL